MKTIEIASASGKRFLRRVAKSGYNYWECVASERGTGWKIEFRRTDKRDVVVQTDAVVSLEGEHGGLVRPFPGSAETLVPTCSCISLGGGAASTAARLLSNGWKICVRHSPGSGITAKKGLAFLDVLARERSTYDGVRLGFCSVFCDGEQILLGSCGT